MDVKQIIKDSVRIEQVVSDLGIQLKKRGNNYQGHCPTGHSSDHGRPFSVDTRLNLCSCFNPACNLGGDVIRLIEVTQNLPFRDALQWLAERYRPDLLSEMNNYKGSRTPEENERIKTYYQKAGLLEAIFEHGHDLLFTEKGKEQLRYLIDDRGYDPEKLKKTDWMFWPSEKEIRNYLREHYGEAKKQIAELKLTGAAGDNFRLAFPYRDRDGAITGFLKRATNPEGISVKGDKNIRWDSTPGLKKDDLFNLNNCKGKQSLLLVEGYPDALYMQTLGFDNVVAVGQGRLGSKHIEALQVFNVKNITISFDNDPPKKDGTLTGVSNTHAAIDMLTEKGIRVYVIDPLKLSPDKDPDEVIRSRGPEAFTVLMEEEEKASVWKTRFILKQHDIKTARGLDTAINEAMAGISLFKDPLDRKDALTALCKGTGYTENDLSEKMLMIEAAVNEERKLKALKDSANRIRAAADKGDLAGVEEDLKKALQDIHQAEGVKIPGPRPFSEVVNRLTTMGEGLLTGFPVLDEIARIPKGAFTIIAGRPGHGKTSFKLNLLVNMLKEYPDKKFYFFSYEEAWFKIATKIIMVHSDVTLNPKTNINAFTNYYREKRGSNPHIEKAIQFFDEVSSSGRLVISDMAYNGRDLAGVIKTLASDKTDTGAVFIDYFQKIPIETQSTRYLDIKLISQMLLDVAVQNDIPVILGSQLNREGIKLAKKEDAGSSIRLEQMRESGDIEQDASLVLGLENMSVLAQETNKDDGSLETMVKVNVLKNREGVSGVIKSLNFKGPTLRYRETQNNIL